MQQRTSSNARAWLINAGLLLLLLTAGCLLLVPAASGPSDPSDRSICRGNLKRVTLAMHNYMVMHGHPPPAYTVDEDGNRLHSWRTLLLPYLEQQALYDSIDLTKPWDDPANARAYDTVVYTYHCPLAKGVPKQHTTYLAITGESFPVNGSDGRKEIPSMPSQRPAFVEVPPSHAVHWMAPDDISPVELLRLCDQQKSTREGVIPVSMFDGSLRYPPPDELKEILLQVR